MHHVLYNLDTINEKLNDSIKSLNIEESKEKDENLDTEINVKSINENLKECTFNNNINHIELNDKEKLNCCKSPQDKEIDNCQNNNTNKCYDTVCTNGNLSKISPHKTNMINSPDTNSSDSNLNDSVDIKCKQFKKDLYQFCQTLKLELEKFDINDQPTIKHIAHLEIEASKKKELENVVIEFENERINSPNPFLFLTELKTIIHDFDPLDLMKEKQLEMIE